MPYDFKSLSSADFEELARDLLQAELGIHLESFKAGRDGGIDLRHSTDEAETLIVQCKHYSNFKSLTQTLKKEAFKVKKLNPTRYILVVSTNCNPQQKDKIKELFSPYIKSTTNDIFCQADLNNLLQRHPKIEKQHFKLWLTSTEVLQKILHSAVFFQSKAQTDYIKHKAKVYVHNKIFYKAEKILGDEHYCIIAGIPGIGKTTLAEMLILYYTNQNYEIVSVTNDIEEAFSIYQPEMKQLFYYDDFLGQTSFNDKLQKNEDRRLLSFIELIQQSKYARLVLTTREYILNQAKSNYERLSRSDFDIKKCVIDLLSYTFSDKAKILFNHLYFSKLSKSYIEQLISGDIFLKIIEHPNYSPRIIEWMTEIVHVKQLEKNNYPDAFLENLNNPQKIWQHAFENQISRPSQYILFCLATLSSSVSLVNLEEAFLKLYKFDSKKYGFSMDPSDLRRGLKELDGSFIKIINIRIANIIAFQNASIRDYLKTYLKSNPFQISSILNSIVFWEQLVAIKTLLNDNKNLQAEFKYALTTFIESYPNKSSAYILNEPENLLLRILEWQVQGQEDFDQSIQKLLQEVIERIDQKESNKPLLVELFEILQKNDELAIYLNTNMITNAKEYLTNNIGELSDFEHLIEFHKIFQDMFSYKEIDDIKDAFEKYSYEHIEELVDGDFNQSPESLTTELYTIQNIADYLEVTPVNLDNLENHISDIKEQEDARNEDESDLDWVETEKIDRENITDLFDLLMDREEVNVTE